MTTHGFTFPHRLGLPLSDLPWPLTLALYAAIVGAAVAILCLAGGGA